MSGLEQISSFLNGFQDPSMTISLSRCAVAGLRTARPMSQDFFRFVKGRRLT